MRKSKEITYTDIGMVCLLAMLFAALVFFAYDSQGFAENAIMLGGATVILLVLYLTGSLLIGLALDTMAVMLFGGFVLLRSYAMGTPPPARLFFFVLWIPLITLAFWLYIRNTDALRNSNQDMARTLERYGTIDRATGLKNMRAFVNDATIYRHLTRRYGIGLALAAWTLVPIDGDYGPTPTEMVKKCAVAIHTRLRTEDEIYLVADDPYTFVMMLVVRNPGDGQVVSARVEQTLRALELPAKISYRVYEWDTQEHANAMELLDEMLKKPEGRS